VPSQTRITRHRTTVNYRTYNAVGNPSGVDEFYQERSRIWNNSALKTKVARARYILQNGFLPTQPYQDDLQQVVNSKRICATGRLKGTSNPLATYEWWLVPNVARVPVSIDDSYLVLLENQAFEKLNSKLSGSGANLPVTLAEARSTIDMIYGAAQRILVAYNHVKRLQFRSAARALGLPRTPHGVSRTQSVQQNWLAYRYGWRLVVMDIESFCKTIYDLLRTKPIVLRMEARKQAHLEWRDVFPGVQFSAPGSGLIIFSVTNHVELHRDYDVRVGYMYQLENVSLAGAQSMGLLNPFVLAFELTPASFMLNWCSNLGSWLEGLTAFQGKKFLDGWACRAMQSSVRHRYANCVPVDVATINSGEINSFHSPWVIERRFQRRIIPGFTHPGIRLEFDMNVQRTLDLLAIVKQVFLDPKRPMTLPRIS